MLQRTTSASATAARRLPRQQQQQQRGDSGNNNNAKANGDVDVDPTLQSHSTLNTADRTGSSDNSSDPEQHQQQLRVPRQQQQQRPQRDEEDGGGGAEIERSAAIGCGVSSCNSSDGGSCSSSSGRDGPLVPEEEEEAARHNSDGRSGVRFSQSDNETRSSCSTARVGTASPAAAAEQQRSAAAATANVDNVDYSHHRPFISELNRLPSQRHWNRRVDVKRPKNLVRKVRLLCGKIVENPTVQMLIITLIVVNAIMMGIATFDFVTDNSQLLFAFETADKVFLCIFTVEIGLQFVYRFLVMFTDGWLVFDFVIVVASWSLESLQIIRAFRIFRAFRLVTRIKPLRDLVMAVAAVMPRMTAIAMLLLLVFYIYAVLFTELFSDLILSEDYFTRLDTSLFTCMELMTLEWASIAREVINQRNWAWAPIVSFIMITGFIVFNLIIAVVCDAVAVVDRDHRLEEMEAAGEQTDAAKLEGAQKRMWDITHEVHTLRKRQQELHLAVTFLAREIRAIHPESLSAPGVGVSLRHLPQQYSELGQHYESDSRDGASSAISLSPQDVARRPIIVAANDEVSCGSISIETGSSSEFYASAHMQMSSMQHQFSPSLSRIDSGRRAPADRPKGPLQPWGASGSDEMTAISLPAVSGTSSGSKRITSGNATLGSRSDHSATSSRSSFRGHTRRGGRRRKLGRRDHRKRDEINRVLVRSASFEEDLRNAYKRQLEMIGSGAWPPSSPGSAETSQTNPNDEGDRLKAVSPSELKNANRASLTQRTRVTSYDSSDQSSCCPVVRKTSSQSLPMPTTPAAPSLDGSMESDGPPVSILRKKSINQKRRHRRRKLGRRNRDEREVKRSISFEDDLEEVYRRRQELLGLSSLPSQHSHADAASTDTGGDDANRPVARVHAPATSNMSNQLSALSGSSVEQQRVGLPEDGHGSAGEDVFYDAKNHASMSFGDDLSLVQSGADEVDNSGN